jgi:hypothetical protein
MNHTPTGWSAPASEPSPITVDSSGSGDRSRSDHPTTAGRPVACVASKAPPAQRANAPPPPQQAFTIHSDVENQRDIVDVPDSDEEADTLACDYAIEQKELAILRTKRALIARKASRSKKSAISSIDGCDVGGDVEDLLNLVADTDPKPSLTEGSLRAHEESQSSQAIHEAAKSSVAILAPPPGIMLLHRAINPSVDTYQVVTQDLEEESARPTAILTQEPPVGQPTVFGPSMREAHNQIVVEVANRAYSAGASAGAQAVADEAEKVHSLYVEETVKARLPSDQKHEQDAILIKQEAERLHELKMAETRRTL